MLMILSINELFSVQNDDIQTEETVYIQQAPYEALHLLGTNMEQLQKDRTKKLLIEVDHSKAEEANISATSKSIQLHLSSRNFVLGVKLTGEGGGVAAMLTKAMNLVCGEF